MKIAKSSSEHTSRRHTIFGAGLIGCYLGAAFRYAKQDVQLVLRKSLKTQLQTQYKITDYHGNEFDVPDDLSFLEEADLPKHDTPADILWLTVKCTSLETAIASMHHCVAENTLIICCQNGINTHLAVKQAFPNNQVIRAMIPFNVVSEKEGHFHRGSQGHLVIESIPEQLDLTKWLASQLASTHLPVDISYDMTSLQWAKLQLNLGNAVNALADIPVKEMLKARHYRVFLAHCMRELLQVTRKKQIKLPKIANVPNKWIPTILSLPDALFTLLAQQMLAIDPKVRTSMWWDLSKGKPTEIDFLNQKVVEEADKLGIEAPCNRFIVSAIKAAEEGDRPNAQTFVSEVKAINEQVDT